MHQSCSRLHSRNSRMSFFRAMTAILSLVSTVTFAQPQGAATQAKPWLGVRIETAKAPETGVLIREVIKGTPADDAGLKKDDRVQSIDQHAVASAEDFITTVQSKGVGSTVDLDFLRDGKAVKKSIKLVTRPDQLALVQQTLVGKLAPAFDLPLISGPGPSSTAALKGRVTVVEFWATWCPACRSTHTALSSFAKRHPKDVFVLAISDESRDELLAYSKALKPEFTILQDKDHEVNSAWMVAAIPQLAVIDRTGKIVFATIGGGAYLDQRIFCRKV